MSLAEGPVGESVRSVTESKDESVNWAIILREKTLTTEGGSSGLGLVALIEALKGLENRVAFICLKVTGVDERDTVVSKRPKFIQINWVGPKVPAMKRMGALQGKNEMSTIFNGVAVTMDITDVDDISMNTVGLTLLQCGGAHKPTYYDYGNDEHFQLDDLKQGA